MHICLPTPGNRDLTVTTPSEEPHSAWKLRLGRQFDSKAEQCPGMQRLQSQGSQPVRPPTATLKAFGHNPAVCAVIPQAQDGLRRQQTQVERLSTPF